MQGNGKYLQFRLLTVLLPLLLCAFPMEAQEPSGLSVIGEKSFGVMNINSGEIILDTLFQEVRIFDDSFVECIYDRYFDGSAYVSLPGPVVEYYNASGNLLSRECGALLSADRPPYSKTVEFAKFMGFNEVQASAEFLAAQDFEAKGLRREAFQRYVAAYKLCPSLSIAKERGMAIRNSIDSERSEVADQLAREALQRQIEAQKRQAAMEAVAASLNATAAAISQIGYAAKAQRSSAAAVKQKDSGEQSLSSSSSSSSSGSSVSSREKKTVTKKSSSSSSSLYHIDFTGDPCTLCRGDKTCNFCYRGKVNGTMTCNYCHGSNICPRCNGTGLYK